MQAADAVGSQRSSSPGGGTLARLRAALPPPAELKKVSPLGGIFFFILFAYTILRDTKDVLVVTAPGSGAEIIPFLKTYVNLPGAIGFTLLYSKLSNKYSQQQVSAQSTASSSPPSKPGAARTLTCNPRLLGQLSQQRVSNSSQRVGSCFVGRFS
jgi:hypothetical protein